LDIRDSIQVGEGKAQSEKNLRYGPKDFESVRVVTAIRKRKATLNEVSTDGNLSSKGTVLGYAESKPGFRKNLFGDVLCPTLCRLSTGGHFLAPILRGVEATEHKDRGKAVCRPRRW
jgi:hypothetical protein